MLNKILGILAGVGATLSTVFFLMFKHEKSEKKAEKEKNKNLNNNLDALAEADKAENEVKKQNEELIKKAHGNSDINAFNACNELLSK